MRKLRKNEIGIMPRVNSTENLTKTFLFSYERAHTYSSACILGTNELCERGDFCENEVGFMLLYVILQKIYKINIWV